MIIERMVDYKINLSEEEWEAVSKTLDLLKTIKDDLIEEKYIQFTVRPLLYYNAVDAERLLRTLFIDTD